MSQVRDLIEDFSLPPWEAPCKVAIIYEAHRMNAEAANTLLKTLEEPPSYGRFLLVTSRPHALLPTVRSRCQTLKFTSLPVQAVEEFLVREKKIALPDAKVAAELSQGSLRQALEFIDPRSAELREEVVDFLEALCSRQLEKSLLMAQVWSQGGPAECRRRLSWVAMLLRYLRFSGTNAGLEGGDPLVVRLDLLRKTISPLFFETSMVKISTAFDLLEANVSSELVHAALVAALSRPGV